LEQQSQRSTWYPQYALTLIFIAYVLNFIDRSILNILAKPIKEDLGLYDRQIGLMGARQRIDLRRAVDDLLLHGRRSCIWRRIKLRGAHGLHE
jgi:hypothetical protein